MAAPRPSDAPGDAHGPGVASVGGSGGPEPAEGDTALRERLADALDPVTVAATPAEVIARHMDGLNRIAVVPSLAAFNALVDAVLPVVQAALAEQTQQVRAQTLREAADLLDSKALHCEEHGSVTCTECPVGSDHLRVWADRIDRPEGTQRDTGIRWDIGKGGLR